MPIDNIILHFYVFLGKSNIWLSHSDNQEISNIRLDLNYISSFNFQSHCSVAAKISLK